MPNIRVPRPRVKRRHSLTNVFREQGFRPALPPHITPKTEAIDRASLARRCCDACGNRGLEYRPFHNATGRYKILGVCLRCGHAEER